MVSFVATRSARVFGIRVMKTRIMCTDTRDSHRETGEAWKEVAETIKPVKHGLYGVGTVIESIAPSRQTGSPEGIYLIS